MPNPANTPAQQDERIPGLPDLPAGADRTTLTIPVYYPGTNKTHQAPLVADDGATTSNAVVGGPKFVQYRDSRLNGVPAAALTLDRLKPATIVPGTEATVQNPANTPLSITEPPKTYVATLVGAGAAGAVMVPRYIGAAASNTVPITWQELVVAAAGDSAPNKNKTPYKPVIFLTQADAIAAGRPDCATLEGLDPLTLCTGTIARVDLYPGASGTELILVYDGSPNPTLRAFIDGNFQRYYGLTQDGLNPMKWVKKGSLAAVLAGITRYSATYDRWLKDETMKIDFNGTDAFFSAVAAGGPFAAPTAAGVGTADWTPAEKPLPQDLSPIVAQHSLQLSTLAVQSSPVFGYLEAGGAPVGYASLDDALADSRPKTFMRFNQATMPMTQSNNPLNPGWASYVDGEGATLELGANVVLSLPGGNVGTLLLKNFFVFQAPGTRGGRVRLLATGNATTPAGQLPRLDGQYSVPVELTGGAYAFTGNYGSLLGTGTAHVFQPFDAGFIAPGITVVEHAGAGGGGGSYTDQEAQAAAAAQLLAAQQVGVSITQDATTKQLTVAAAMYGRLSFDHPRPGTGNLARRTFIVTPEQEGVYQWASSSNVDRVEFQAAGNQVSDTLAKFKPLGFSLLTGQENYILLTPLDVNAPVFLSLLRIS